MRDKVFIVILATVATVVVGLAGWLLFGSGVSVMSPAGTIAAQQRDLIVFTSLLGLLVIVPVFVLTFTIVWKYREGNTKAKYTPEWDHDHKLEAVWWGIPFALILVLSVVTWQTTHSLDPYKPLVSTQKPLKIQVVAMQWKWLFIYPELGIATVNQLQLPVDRPVNFEITSDAPMNSFWIPKLAGQVYAMSGMSTQLHLQATQVGDYQGVSANLSGSGFAGMKFTANASTPENFNRWVVSVQQTGQHLDGKSYEVLARPSEYVTSSYYATVEPGLYTNVMHKYMAPEMVAE